MNAEAQKKLNNLYLRYKNYDKDGTKYVYDIYFDTLDGERQLKAKRQTGEDKFRTHIEEIMGQFSDVGSITVTDYNGENQRSGEMNPPVTVYLTDVKNTDAAPGADTRREPYRGTDILLGLSGLFGPEYEGYGNAAPLAKLIDDRHVIERLNEKNDDRAREIEELKRKNDEMQKRYETLTADFERLQDEADDMEDELCDYRERDRRQSGLASVLGPVGASIAKNFLRQNPKILSGIIPAEQLAGLLSDDDPPAPAVEAGEKPTEEEQKRTDEATVVFEWLQTLDAPTFAKVIAVIGTMQQNNEYTDIMLAFLKGNKNLAARE